MIDLITKRSKFVRVRVLVYTHSSQAQLDKQRLNDLKSKQVYGANGMTLESYELNPLRMTLLELIRLWWREGRRG